MSTGRLKEIVEYVKSNFTLKNLAITNLELKTKLPVGEYDENTPDDPEKEKMLIQAAREILKKDKLEIE